MAARQLARDPWPRLSVLRSTTGTGHGINRIPVQNPILLSGPQKNVPAPLVHRPQTRVTLVRSMTDLLAGPSAFSKPIWIGNRWHITVVVPNVDTAPEMQTDMRHYWKLCRDKTPLEILHAKQQGLANYDWRERTSNLKRWVPGWRPKSESVSPFGKNRFRTFDPAPSYEYVAGPLRIIQC